MCHSPPDIIVVMYIRTEPGTPFGFVRIQGRTLKKAAYTV